MQNAIKYINTVFFLKISYSSLSVLIPKTHDNFKDNYSMEDAPRSLPNKATARHQNTYKFHSLEHLPCSQITYSWVSYS